MRTRSMVLDRKHKIEQEQPLTPEPVRNEMFVKRRKTEPEMKATKKEEVRKVKKVEDAVDMPVCCGKREAFTPKTLICQNDCLIVAGQKYYLWLINGVEHTFCQPCFRVCKGKKTGQSTDEKAGLCMLMVNNKKTPEPVLTCAVCRSIYHAVCELFLVDENAGNSNAFVCKSCSHMFGYKYSPNSADDLLRTEMSDFMENAVGEFLQQNELNKKVRIRVLRSSSKRVKLKPLVVGKYGPVKTALPYTEKVVFAFEEIGGMEVAFFSFICQEYTGCSPNGRSAYLSYLDSVNHFEPKEYRTAVYQKILLSYFDYLKCRNYENVFIWACPPNRNSGPDYIFYGHPPAMKVPNQKRLQTWYKQLFSLGVKEGILESYSTWFDYLKTTGTTNVTDIPYFDGDFWPGFYEDLITTDGTKFKTYEAINVNRYKNKKNRFADAVRAFGANKPLDGMMRRVISEMYQTKNSFLVARLDGVRNQDWLFSDNEISIDCPLLESREEFVNFAALNNYEFSSVRRAKYSTQGLLAFILEPHKFIFNVVVDENNNKQESCCIL